MIQKPARNALRSHCADECESVCDQVRGVNAWYAKMLVVSDAERESSAGTPCGTPARNHVHDDPNTDDGMKK